eukprot:g12841.t1
MTCVGRCRRRTSNKSFETLALSAIALSLLEDLSPAEQCGTACPFDTVAFVGAGSFGRLFGAQLLVAVMCLAAREALQVSICGGFSYCFLCGCSDCISQLV